jgi:low temperature requirement protein LtrA
VTVADANTSLTTVRMRVRMTARSIDEPDRVASQLELLFDLTFVVAIASATDQFARSVAGGDALDGLPSFLQVFFAIWWAWMNFTWFASSYDTDDVAYRVLTLVQMAGVLVLSAGVPPAFAHGDYRAVGVGYAMMRIGLVAQWVRAGIEDTGSRSTALRYAAAIGLVQFGWLLFAFAAGGLPPGTRTPGFVLLAALELAIPRWAERAGPTNWHPHHIAERYGLFTIILLGEVVLAATTAVQRAMQATRISVPLVTISGCALLLVFAHWWLYFLHPAGPGLLARREHSYRWGYGHYAIFTAVAALGAGLDVAVEQTAGHTHTSPTTVGYAVAIPMAVFVLALRAVHQSISNTPILRGPAVLGWVVVVLLLPLATPWTGAAVTVAALTAAGVLLTAGTTIRRARESRDGRTCDVGVERTEGPENSSSGSRHPGERPDRIGAWNRDESDPSTSARLPPHPT